MHPLLGLRIPSAARRNDMQMRVVLAVAAMSLHDHDIATLEGFATDLAKEIAAILNLEIKRYRVWGEHWGRSWLCVWLQAPIRVPALRS